MTKVKRAMQTWPILLGAAHNRQTLTYTIVADLIEMGPGTLAQVLDVIMRYCKRHGLPPLTSLVVNKHTGQPGIGLTTLEELNRDRERVFNFKWYALPPIQNSDFDVSD